MNSSARIVFCYDIVCPFAYMASERIEEIARNGQGTVEWSPVLLGGLYDLTKALQGKHGSATDVMPSAKKTFFAIDLKIQSLRHGIPLKRHPRHPVSTVLAMRVLTAVRDHEQRAHLSHFLFRAYWEHSQDVDDVHVLSRYCRMVGLDQDFVQRLIDDKEEYDQVKSTLYETTRSIAKKGAFGVPVMFVGQEMIWGADRLHFVEFYLKKRSFPHPVVCLPRYKHLCTKPVLSVRFYLDFSSPWCYVGWTQLYKHLNPLATRIDLHPFLLGGLFKAIGTPNVPGAAISRIKRRYMEKDMQRWLEYWGITNVFRFPDIFPIRSVDLLRLALLEPRCIDILFRCVWQWNVDVSNRGELCKVLKEHGILGVDEMMKKIDTEEVKSLLYANTKYAIDQGVVGVPSYQIVDEKGENGVLMWGQDRIDVVQDLLSGWKPL